ncbi:platelet glycoprotein Ib alpha chain-like [Penaeus vannamei]|uniref:platelet glycoprotein Ib alpha chain-like n=1 Tax=Penaeus vannamei TaxID=6689 RepID=UPI00387FB19B
MYFIEAVKFESEVATLRYKNGHTLREARQEARRQGFSHTPYSSNIVRSALPPPPQNVPITTSTFYIPQTNSFATLNPDTPISTTAISTTAPTPTTLPPRTTRSRQTKRSNPSSPTAQSPPPTYTFVPETPVSSSPPHKKTFVPQNSPTNSIAKTITFSQNSNKLHWMTFKAICLKHKIP